MKRALSIAALLAISSFTFAATPVAPAASGAVVNKAAVKRHQRDSATARARALKNAPQSHVTPRAPTRAASSTK